MKENKYDKVLTIIGIIGILLVVFTITSIFYDKFTKSPEIRFCKQKGYPTINLLIIELNDPIEPTKIKCGDKKIWNIKKICKKYHTFYDKCIEYKYLEEKRK